MPRDKRKPIWYLGFLDILKCILKLYYRVYTIALSGCKGSFCILPLLLLSQTTSDFPYGYVIVSTQGNLGVKGVLLHVASFTPRSNQL